MGGTSMRLLALSVFTMFYAAFASSIQTVPLLEEFMQASSLAADAALEVSANVLPSPFHQQRRSFSAVCPTIKSLDKDTFAAAGKSLSATAPAKCFTKFMNAMLAMLKTTIDKDCATMIKSTKTGKCRLLGGLMKAPKKKAVKQMEMAFGFLCAKNGKGKYCASLMTKLDSSKKTKTETKSSDTCPLSTTEKSDIEEFGCCWKTVGMMSAAFATDATKDPTATMRMKGNKNAKACDITLDTKVCKGSVKTKTVETNMKLKGFNAADCDKEKKISAIQKVVAKVAKAEESQVAVEKCEASTRRAGVTVDASVTCTGDDADTVAAEMKKSLTSDALDTAMASESELNGVTSDSVATADGASSAGAGGGSASGTSTTAHVSLAALLMGLVANLFC